MERIRIIYGRNNLPFSWLIRLFTWSRWSHCGVVIDDYVIESVALKGVTKTPIKEFKARYNTTFEGWMPATEGWQHRAQEHIGNTYDLLAILGIVFRVGSWHRKGRWFCSELVAYISGIFRCDRGARVTPEICYKVTKDDE